MKTWTTKTGRKIRIKGMADSHLINTIRMLERNHGRNVCELYSISGFIQGEQASYDIDSAISQAEDEGPNNSYPIYDDLVEEAMKRGLMVYSNEVNECELQR